MSSHGDPVPMTARKGAALKGVADVPGDKSISHRSLILGAMAVGETVITGLLEGRCDAGHVARATGLRGRRDAGSVTGVMVLIGGVVCGGFARNPRGCGRLRRFSACTWRTADPGDLCACHRPSVADLSPAMRPCAGGRMALGDQDPPWR